MIEFPIVRKTQELGVDSVRYLDKGEVVNYFYCGEPITINENTVRETAFDMPVIFCAECRRVTPAYRYVKRREPDYMRRKDYGR